MPSKDHIISEIRRTAEENGGRPLGRIRFQAETGIKESDIIGKYWVKWSDAVAEAGYEPNEMQTALSNDHLIGSLVSLIRELGRFPTSADIKLKSRSDSNFPSHNTFNKLGPKADRARRIIDYCDKRGDFNDVVALCRPFAALSSPITENEEETATEVFGFVYLMKSGKYYKIGRSVCAEKRTYEVRLQLPEELKLVHKIKTDDPAGIEAYWHQRFSEKRVRGEWFSLSKQDIKAFRKRKFM